MSCPVESHGKDGKQRTFPTFPTGTATAIYMNLFTKFVALGLCMYPRPPGVAKGPCIPD
jgi:hypothetical protein